MSQAHSDRKMGFGVLYFGLLAALALFGVPAKHPPAMLAVSAALFLVICAAAWSVISNSLASEDESRRTLAITGLLLIAPFALFAWLPGYGPPEMATAAQNEVRYLVLLVGTFLVSAGFVMLARSSLSAANERSWSSLGFACALVAAPLYAVFCAVQLATSASVAPGTQEAGPSGLLDTVSLILLFFGACLGYFATLFFTMSLAKVGWVSRGCARALIVFSSLGLLSLVTAKALSTAWFELPLFIAAIPAVPWIMPALIGLGLLRRSE